MLERPWRLQYRKWRCSVYKSVLASETLEFLFPKVQNPTVYILCDIRSLCIILSAINSAACHLGILRHILVAWRL